MQFFMTLFFTLNIIGAFGSGSLAGSCGDALAPCQIGNGSYHILLPENEPMAGTVIHLHGGGGTGKALLKSGLARLALARGFAFIAPNGEHPGHRYPKNWAVRADNTQFQRDDIRFLRDVLRHASDHHGVDDDLVLLSGFSRGGSMVWDIACHAPDFALAYAPVAGAFWDSLPSACSAPIALFHTHGWNDRTVPLEGRPLRSGRVYQGDVWASLAILRAVNGCTNRQPATSTINGDQWHRHWSDCRRGRLDLLLHAGGHGVPSGWAKAVLDWFVARLASK